MLPSTKFLSIVNRAQECHSRILNNFIRNVNAQSSNSSLNTFTERSHNCGQLTRDNVGEQVKLYGWVQYTRFDNKIIALRDSYGVVQCIVDKSLLTKAFRSKTIHNESVIKLIGHVQTRPDKQINKLQANGDIEVLADQLEVLSQANADMPILTRENDNEISLINRLRYRYLDLRSRYMQDSLRMRSRVCQILRNKLISLGFVDCETPTLFRRTPGGANEFIVPTQLEDKYYTLTQSPQQLKQLLMIGGLDRYFQICRCYRDEAGRADRQPEFTQLDIELSFTNQTLIMNLITELMYNLMVELELDVHSIFDETKSLPKITYQEAMFKYGTDKPDLRFGWQIETTTDGMHINIPHRLSDGLLSQTLERIRLQKQLDISTVSVEIIDGQTTVKAANRDFIGARTLLGQLRLYLAKELERQGLTIYETPFRMLWVTEFPLFVKDEETGILESNHHPFTAPSTHTRHLLKSNPIEVIGQHYDLVLNGQEIAGGSIRIHDPVLQSEIFKDALGLEDKTFKYFIEALNSGCPPHGGIAVGLDRFVAILMKRDSIRDVIAFPKSSAGRDIMSDSPHDLDRSTRRMYNLK